MTPKMPRYFHGNDQGTGWPVFIYLCKHNSQDTENKVYVENGAITQWLEWANSISPSYSYRLKQTSFKAFRVKCSLEVINLLERLAQKAGYIPGFHPPKSEAISFGINADKEYSWGTTENWGSALQQLTVDEAIEMINVSLKKFRVEFIREIEVYAETPADAHIEASKLKREGEGIIISKGE